MLQSLKKKITIHLMGHLKKKPLEFDETDRKYWVA